MWRIFAAECRQCELARRTGLALTSIWATRAASTEARESAAAAKEQAHEAKEKLKESAHAAKEMFKEGAAAAKEKLKDAKDTIVEGAQEGAAAAKDKLKDAKDKVVEGAHNLKEKITGSDEPNRNYSEFSSRSEETLRPQDAYVDLSRVPPPEPISTTDASEYAAAAKQQAHEAKEKTKEGAQAAKEMFKEGAAAAKEKLKDAKDKVVEGAHNLKEKITGNDQPNYATEQQKDRLPGQESYVDLSKMAGPRPMSSTARSPPQPDNATLRMPTKGDIEAQQSTQEMLNKVVKGDNNLRSAGENPNM
jgi:hypothetical protein